jgi:predicted 3-demethylubiquinone-9 3-methyltransferase (glyoxalase superfamily)
MAPPRITKITPFLWFQTGARDAAAFYTGIFPDSRIDRVTTMPAAPPPDPGATTTVVEFTLAGDPFIAMTSPTTETFNQTISFTVLCDDQAEIDRYTEALSRGGSLLPCGWLRDRFGVSWQITPRALFDMIAAPDRAAAKRATEAMLTMQKLDLAALRAAFAGS